MTGAVLNRSLMHLGKLSASRQESVLKTAISHILNVRPLQTK